MEINEIEINSEINGELKSCILCLFPVSEAGETKLYKLPCECNTLCHKSCLKSCITKENVSYVKPNIKPAERDKNEDIFLYEDVDVNTDSDDSGDSYEYFDYNDYVMRIITECFGKF